MSLLKSFEFIPGIKWFESEMHNTLFQHSVFGAIVFLIVSNTGVYKFVKDTIFQCCGVKLDGNTLQLVHAVVFMVIMYFGSMYLFAPLLGEGNDPAEPAPPALTSGGADLGRFAGAREAQSFEQGGVTALLDRLRIEGGAQADEMCNMDPESFIGQERDMYNFLCNHP
jgi:hypothetical protein